GNFKNNYRFFFNKKPENPSFLTAKLQVDTGFNIKLRSNLINDVPLNYALLELFGQASVNAGDNFDKLFVPFRCIVADVLSQEMIPVSMGSLPEAIRGTFTVPLVYRPVKVNEKYVFDGGLYNNFPVDVLKKEFKPDYMIGSNVSSKIFNDYPKEDDEKLMNRFLVYMFLSKSDSTSIGKNGAYIQPDLTGFSTTDFSPVAELIKRGYDATIANMVDIKNSVSARTSAEELAIKRAKFKNRKSTLEFDEILATGVNPRQKRYVETVINSSVIENPTIEQLKPGYYKLVADDNFETVYPRIRREPNTDGYDFEVQVQREKNFKLDFGGAVSTRPISNAYVGLQYNYLRKNSYTFSANFYAGGFYESAQGMSRMDVPGRLPFFVEAEFTYNHWNYFNKSQIFIEDIDPTFIEQSDKKSAVKLGFPLSNNGKMELQAGIINFSDHYSPNRRFQFGDILDRSSFDGLTSSLTFSKNLLNRRMYATEGSSFRVGINVYSGKEKYIPGNILRGEVSFSPVGEKLINRNWFQAKLSREQYPFHIKRYSFGYLTEIVISNKPAFSTYKSTLLSAPAFYPLQDSKSLYLEKFRANSYGALGIKNVFNLGKNLDARAEFYIFQPVEEYELNKLQSVSYGDLFAKSYLAATAGLVYHTLVGPISLSLNHYDDDNKRFGVMFHAGFLIYNKRSFE
ncbi:MAG: patatin-like phospholipase family protein, partial [Daejeonella sp.]|uniref:patatin-like phospholipase family protein n=1 Tax=Daejeonella sp. TaxID=2805397 RepID=UPI003C7689A1